MYKKLINKISNIAGKIAGNDYILIIRQGLAPTLPLLMICSVFMIIVAFPLDIVVDFVNSVQIGEVTLSALLIKGMNACYNILGLLMTIGIAYSYAKVKNLEKINLCILAVTCFVLIMPYSDGAISVSRTGSNGLLIGMLTSLLVGRLYEVIHSKGWKISMPKGTPEAVIDSFIALIPSAIVILVFFLIYAACSAFGTNAFDLFGQIIGAPLGLLVGSLGGYMFLYLIKMILWALGINDPIIYSICAPWLLAWDAQNIAYFSTGVGSPSILNTTFEYHYIAFGGGGCVLALIVVMFFFTKSARMKKMRMIGAVPALFNISEPMVYGLPMMLNPYMVIPMIICPLVNIALAYFATSIGVVAYASGASIAWTCPIVISGFLAGGVSIAIMQIVLFIIDMLIYLPFTIALDKRYIKEELEGIESVEEDIDLDNIDLDNL